MIPIQQLYCTTSTTTTMMTITIIIIIIIIIIYHHRLVVVIVNYHLVPAPISHDHYTISSIQLLILRSFIYDP